MEWKKVKLGEVLTIKYGKDHKALGAGNIPVYGSGGIMRYADKAIYEKPSILIPRKGSLNNIFYVDKPFWTVDTMFWSIIDTKKADPHFLFYAICKLDFAGLNVGSAVPSLTVPVIEAVELPLPPLETQRRIAAILSSLDDKIENNNRINRNLEEQAQALFKSWFVDFEPWGGTMPDDWRKQKLGQIIELYRGVSYSSKDIKEGDYALLSMNNIRPWGGFLYDFSRKFSGRFKEIHKLNPYDLIMCITDITQERRLIGYTALIPPYYDNLIMCTHLLKVTSEKYDSRFLNGLFNYSGLSRFIADCATGTTVLGLTADIVKGIEWTIPTPEAAKKYSNMVIDMYDSIFRNNQESQRLATLRDTLLPKLMRGEITL